MEKQTTERYQWVNCCNCGGRLFRYIPVKRLSVEIFCPHCKGIWEVIIKESASTEYNLVRAPKYSYKPKEFKDKGDSP